MTRRKHIGVGYHHNGILVMSAFGLAILYTDYQYLGKDAAAIVLAVVCIGAVMLLQLVIDYRTFEKDYIFMTTEQSVRFGSNIFKERIKYKWPLLLLIPLMFVLQFTAAAGAFFLFTLLTYPLQRAMYLRSLKEFGTSEKSAT